ncbi:MAG: NUDIX hydrolase [Ardenticatenia bacterium]|nr:NUDIX hydrolase [Ardenticatenia bacterium]
MLSEQVVYQDRWVRVVLAEVRLPTGERYTYTALRRVPGAAVVAVNAQGELLIQEEYRYPLDAVVYQVPGGLVEPGESPLDAARRELLEEAGYEAEEWRFLGTVEDNPGLIEGTTTLFLARGLHLAGSSRPDTAEFVTHHWRSPAWLRRHIAEGAVQDRVVLAAYAFLVAHGVLEERG